MVGMEVREEPGAAVGHFLDLPPEVVHHEAGARNTVPLRYANSTPTQ